MAWIRGRLENSQGDTSQPVETDDSGDEKPPQLEGEENEKGLEGNEGAETEEEVEQPGQEEVETEQHEDNPLQNPLQEDESANMGEYAQPLSPLNLRTEEGPKEQSAHDKNTSEELCNEKEGLKEHSIHDKSASEELCDEKEEDENHSTHNDSVSREESVEDKEEEQSIPSQIRRKNFMKKKGWKKKLPKR